MPRGHSPAEHDERLERALAEKEPVMLWFEADLFDVLLLIQILERVPPGAPVMLVLVGQERWESVTDIAPGLLALLGRDAPRVGDAQLELARTAWAAFTAPTPVALQPLAAGTPPLPAVGDALHRLLEELPWADTGLSRTERQLLSPRSTGSRRCSTDWTSPRGAGRCSPAPSAGSRPRSAGSAARTFRRARRPGYGTPGRCAPSGNVEA